MKRETLLAAALALSALYLIVTLMLPFAPSVHRLKSVSARWLSYDSQSQLPIYQHLESQQTALKDFSASMTFQSYATTGFKDLFQTAPFNTGARVEVAGGTIGLVIAAQNPQGFVAHVLATNVDPTKPHLLDIAITRDNTVSAVFDHQPVLNAVDPNLDYAISDVTVGNGFSKERAFSGKIRDFQYSYNFYEQEPPTLMPWVRIGLILLCVGALILLIRARKPDRFSIFDPVGTGSAR